MKVRRSSADTPGVRFLFPRRLLPLAAAAAAATALLLGTGSALAAVPVPSPTPQNTTPACPVSPSQPVCAWNVPADAHNAFSSADYGECPYWAAEKYPTLVADEASNDTEGSNWNGFTWLEHAVAELLTTSATPVSGDLAVWSATSDDPYGHVAYVEAVLPHGIIVSQMDGQSVAPFPAMQGSTEYIHEADLQYFAASDGLRYVATGDPSPTPVADIEQPGANFGDTAPSTTSRPAASRTASGQTVRHRTATRHHTVARHHAATRRGRTKPKATMKRTSRHQAA